MKRQESDARKSLTPRLARTSGVVHVGSRSARHLPHTVKGVIATLDTDFPGAAAA
jgi:hypothetical protein